MQILQICFRAILIHPVSNLFLQICQILCFMIRDWKFWKYGQTEQTGQKLTYSGCFMPEKPKNIQKAKND